MAKKIIRLTERDLTRIIQRVISEQNPSFLPSNIPDPWEVFIRKILDKLNLNNGKIVLPDSKVLTDWFNKNGKKLKEIINRYYKEKGMKGPTEIFIGNRNCYPTN